MPKWRRLFSNGFILATGDQSIGGSASVLMIYLNYHEQNGGGQERGVAILRMRTVHVGTWQYLATVRLYGAELEAEGTTRKLAQRACWEALGEYLKSLPEPHDLEHARQLIVPQTVRGAIQQ